MANTTIEIKFSQVSGNTPSTLANGEISINTADGRFFYKSPSGTITPFARYPGPAGLNGEIQFNDSGVLGSSANLSINKTTGVLTVGGAVVTNAYVQFSDGTRQYTANAGSGGGGVTSVAGATGVVSNTQLINAVTSTNQITFNSIVTSNNGQGTNFRVGDDAWIGDVNVADTIRITGLQNAANGWLRFGWTGTEALGRANSGPLLWGANTIWHSGNDGIDSGLDADLLDGVQGSSYVTLTGTQTLTNKTFTGNVNVNNSLKINALDGYFTVQQNNSSWTNSTDHPIIRWNYNATYDDHLYLASGGNQVVNAQSVLVISENSGLLFGRGNNSSVTTLGTQYFQITNTGNVGVGTVSSPAYKLEVNGSFAATTKSFVIPHPTKEGMKLRYGSLEGPENGVYIRGKIKENIIELPDYWTTFVDPESITVNLTPIGNHQNLFVEKIENNKVYIGKSNLINKDINCFFTVFAERCDVEKLKVEYAAQN